MPLLSRWKNDISKRNFINKTIVFKEQKQPPKTFTRPLFQPFIKQQSQQQKIRKPFVETKQGIKIRNDIPSNRGSSLNGKTTISIFDNQQTKVVRSKTWSNGILVDETTELQSPKGNVLLSKGKYSEDINTLGVKTNYFINGDKKQKELYKKGIPFF